MINKIRELMSSDNRNIREKLFVIVCLEGIIGALFCLLECISIRSGWPTYIIIGLTLVIIPWAVNYICDNGGRELPIAVVTIWMDFVTFPTIFLTCGGVKSGSSCWLAMGIIYIFLVYRGKMLKILVTATILIDSACYAVAFLRPEIVKPLNTEAAQYIDSLFGAIAVGVTAGLVFSFRRAGYGRENAMAIRQRNEIDRINASREKFYANFSHEIRNPINAIIGLNELNIRNSKDKEITRNSEAIAGSGKLLLSIVNDIMDLSQMESKSMKLASSPFDSSDLLNKIMDMISVRAKEKNLELILEADPEIPAVLVGDERRLIQILINLMTNAVKYTKEGHVKLSVISEKKEDDNVTLKASISDTGIGIEKENLEHIFETFAQFDRNENGDIEGNGLGLPIAYSLTQIMGGKLTVDSVYGSGSVFTVEVTLGYEGDEVMGASTYEEISESRGESEGGYVRSFEASKARILVVDDDAQNRSIITGLLKDTKVTVSEAGSGEEALKLTAANRYDVIVVDYLMPGMNGSEVLEAVRSQSGGKCKDSAIIALTGAMLDSGKHNNALYEFDMVLTKPVEYTVLEDAIASSLPAELIEYRDNSRNRTGALYTRVMPKKKRRLRITTESICDLPEDVIRKFDIGIMYLYIRTARGRFMDTVEIDSMDLMGKLTDSSSEVHPDGATVEEYERFFKKELESSEDIIHLSFSSRMGESCNRAMEAAKGFSHVHVIDSGLISSALGLLAMIAAGWAGSDRSVDEICDDIGKISKHIVMSYVLPSASIYSDYGKLTKKTGELYDIMNIHPAISLSGGKLKQTRIYRGDMESVIDSHIKTTLLLAGRMDLRVPVIVTHVALSPRIQNNIMSEMRGSIPDNALMLTKSSVSSAGNIGQGGMGIAYLKMTHFTDWKDLGVQI